MTNQRMILPFADQVKINKTQHYTEALARLSERMELRPNKEHLPSFKNEQEEWTWLRDHRNFISCRRKSRKLKHTFIQ